MKKSIRTKKLVVSTQIIRSLQPDALLGVAGGVIVPSKPNMSLCGCPGTGTCEPSTPCGHYQ